MSKYLITILLFLISIVSTSKIKKSHCVAYGGDCDATSYCCSGMVCKDYRCAVKGTADNQEAWAPDGVKCDWFHHCGKNYKCQSHRCVFQIKDVIKALSKKVKKVAEDTA